MSSVGAFVFDVPTTIYFDECSILRSPAALLSRPPQVDGDFFIRTRQWKGRDMRRGVRFFSAMSPNPAA